MGRALVVFAICGCSFDLGNVHRPGSDDAATTIDAATRDAPARDAPAADRPVVDARPPEGGAADARPDADLGCTGDAGDCPLNTYCCTFRHVCVARGCGACCMP